jgi:hypothetical protein
VYLVPIVLPVCSMYSKGTSGMLIYTLRHNCTYGVVYLLFCNILSSVFSGLHSTFSYVFKESRATDT